MQSQLTISNLSTGEKVGFGLSILGVTILLILTVKATITTGITPKIEQRVFSAVFFLTLVFLGGVVISHYTKAFSKLKETIF